MNKRRAVWLREDQWELVNAILSVAASNNLTDGTAISRVALDWCVTRIAEIRDAIEAAQ